MKLCKVVGSIWATKKDSRLEGAKLMLIKPLFDKREETIIAADFVGAGIGENVLVVRGSIARYMSDKERAPLDAAIVAIVDSVELAESERAKYEGVGE